MEEIDRTGATRPNGLTLLYMFLFLKGWWLSMKPDDSFLNRIQPLSDFSKLIDNSARFKERNDQTIGFIIYSALEQDLMRAHWKKELI